MGAEASDGLALALEALDALPGWKAFPVQPNKKPYAGTHGFKDATDDPDALAKMWRPRALPALAVPSGWVVVDLDSEEAMERWEGEVTKAQLTRRGRHLFYRTREDIRPMVALEEGVDLRGPGSYVVLYERWWLKRAKTAYAPKTLYEQAKREALDLSAEENEVWGEGERDAALTRAAGKLKNAGLSTNELLAALLKMNEQRCDPPLSRRDVEKIARSSMDWEVAEEPKRLPFPRIEFRRGKRSHAPVASDPVPRGIDAAELVAMHFEPLAYVVEDLIPEGTAILAAEPKIGKSWLAYQMCVEVAFGGDLLGRAVTPGSALYYALEDGPRRGKDRLVKALAGRVMPKGRLEVRWTAPPIGGGLEEELAEWLDSHDDGVLVVIDTLQKARPPSSGRRGSYEVDVEDLGRVQNVFRNRRVTLLIIHHARKAKGDDFLAAVSGTYGITGSADTTLVIKRPRGDQDAVLDVTGRDVFEQELGLRFDPDSLWQKVSVVEVKGTNQERAILEYLRKQGPATATVIAQGMGRGDASSRTSIQHSLKDMREAGVVVVTEKRGEYTLPDEDEDE